MIATIIGAIVATSAFIYTVLNNSENTKAYNFKHWDGTWEHTFASSIGNLKGKMKLITNKGGNVSGTYDYQIGNNVIEGSIKGIIDTKDDLLNGAWKNNKGEWGRFFLRLNEDKNSFSGRYSLSDNAPDYNSFNIWRGIKTDK